MSLSLSLVPKSCLTLATPWTVACQAPLSVGFSRQEYWSGLPFPSPGDLPDPGIETGSPAVQEDSLPTELWINVYSNIKRRRQWQPTPVLLPGKSHGQRILVGCSPWGRTESRHDWHDLAAAAATILSLLIYFHLFRSSLIFLVNVLCYSAYNLGRILLDLDLYLNLKFI